MDAGFLLTLGIIFLFALFGSYIGGRRRDACLKDFDGYHITVEKTSGRLIWGTMQLFSSGIEFEYKTNVQDQAHVETSYFMYKAEYAEVQALYRYADELSAENQLERDRALEKSFHPGPLRVLSRKLSNFANTAGDSLSEAIGYVTGQARAKQKTQALSETGEAYLKKLGKDLIGHMGNSFDPLLESCVGVKVVVELLEGENVRERVGVLKDYSADFLEILDVLYPQTLSISLASQEERDRLANDIRITVADGSFQIENLTEYPLLLHEIKCGERQGEINAVVGPGDTVGLQPLALTQLRTACEEEELAVFFEGLSGNEEAEREQDAEELAEQEHAEASRILSDLEQLCGSSEDIAFSFKMIRVLDMIVPRARALVRHKAERYDPENVFGSIDFSLPFLDSEENLEQEYRKQIEDDPEDAQSAMGLARLLIQRADYAGAATALRAALANRGNLVDGGRLAALQLQYVEKKLKSLRGERGA
jgi:hypothetical protein